MLMGFPIDLEFGPSKPKVTTNLELSLKEI